MGEGKLLIVDDDEGMLELMKEFLVRHGFDVTCLNESRHAFPALKSNRFDILITELVMPKVDGVQLINFIQKEYLDTLGIIITGNGSLQTAIAAFRSGAFDYILKPVDFQELLDTVNSAMHYRKLMKNHLVTKDLKGRANLLRRFSESRLFRENTNPKRQEKEKYNLIGMSFPMQKVFEMIEKVADTHATVLITGESGVGKELVARAIHSNSSRKDNPLVIVNCGAIPETLLESELFGYEKGAFTGAFSTKVGRFEIANGGTIFLDEVGDMSLNMQVKLLRILQEKEFERIGGTRPIKVDVRVIAATNRDLEQLVKDGKFREDLYYRLNVVPIHIPPLRERKEDIPLLVDHFLKLANNQNNCRVEGISEEAMLLLTEYDYPGNVRELQNIIERIVVLRKKGIIQVEDLPEKVYGRGEPKFEFDLKRGYDVLVTEFEKNLIMKALSEAHGVKSKAAKVLNLNRTTLIEKMKRLGISEMSKL
ncbi:MAG: sigma-54 dependent transcriptional regulator [Deltaproteobacteria bacterium]|nr:sigma-54 dependent transcriptional regulator [Deltaproteobacteria bacterium]